MRGLIVLLRTLLRQLPPARACPLAQVKRTQHPVRLQILVRRAPRTRSLNAHRLDGCGRRRLADVVDESAILFDALLLVQLAADAHRPPH